MGTSSLTGNDTVTINGRNLTDFGDGDILDITFPNELVAVKKGKNQNSIFAYSEDGTLVNVSIRLIRSSPDDKFINSLRITMKQDFSAFSLITADFVKRVGDGLGNVSREIYALTGGVFAKESDTKSNTSGDTDQAVSIYNFTFTNGEKTIA